MTKCDTDGHKWRSLFGKPGRGWSKVSYYGLPENEEIVICINCTLSTTKERLEQESILNNRNKALDKLLV